MPPKGSETEYSSFLKFIIAHSSTQHLRGSIDNLSIAISRSIKKSSIYQVMTPDNRRGDQLINTSIALGVVATIAVILRFLARWKSKANFGSDDIFIAISLILQYGMVILISQGLSTLLGCDSLD